MLLALVVHRPLLIGTLPEALHLTPVQGLVPWKEQALEVEAEACSRGTEPSSLARAYVRAVAVTAMPRSPGDIQCSGRLSLLSAPLSAPLSSML
ncbi:hypothetical protein NQZ68_037077 [Dissostichus eleginoides]|nr:hypothetical protein NQZ68_037077 [Dissostichus eleginoides]